MRILSALRSVIGIFVFIPWTVFWSIAMISATFFRAHRSIEDKIIGRWCRGVLAIFGVKVKTRGMDLIPSGACLFLFNHTSFFDIFSMAAVYPHFRFGAKIELFSIPFFGKAMERAGVLPIERARREKVFRVYSQAEERTARGEKFALAPEGSRNSEERLLPFKSGPFIFAIDSKMPIVPVVIKGANEVLGKGQFLPNFKRWGGEISIEFLPAIPTKDFTQETRSELQQVTRKAMLPFFSGSPE
ncbi:MAG: 1-acyl-sn-glycerol-3-phosphate acyltransferase [Bdellovibrio sp. CG10_big_fil_rev_8_21_14_0_10_47_8]|nr:MAG: 1-acyl-sn-glycerol-3-phosphate acyltransferase [Bdellovibrio sp. CG10_big_fil_rev_8_21_14_0_10_47_8]